jgi:hypothetical protein
MPVFTIEAAAWLLGVNDDTLRHWAHTDQLATTATPSGDAQ